MGYTRIIESDAKEAVDNLNSASSYNTASLLHLQLLPLLNFDWEVQIIHVPREENVMADTLAKKGLQDSSLLNVVPPYLRDQTLLTKSVRNFKSPLSFNLITVGALSCSQKKKLITCLMRRNRKSGGNMEFKFPLIS